MAPANTSVPWSVSIPVGQIAETGLHQVIEADAQQRLEIAALAGLPELVSARATFDVTHAGGNRFHVTGEVEAKVTQTCVVSLEPFENTIHEAIDIMFVPEIELATMSKKVVDIEDAAVPDPPEPIVNGAIDLGALATEFIILGINPYPRKPGVAFDIPQPGPDPEDHPFAALKVLKTSPVSNPRTKASKKD